MADTVEINAQGDATPVKAVEENSVEPTTTTVETSTNENAVDTTEQTTTTLETSTNDSNDKPNETESSTETAALKRKAEDVSEEVDETKKSKVDETSVENGHESNGHTEEQVPVVEELPAVPAKTKTVEDVARLTAEAEENAA